MPDYSLIRNKVRSYLKMQFKGYTPNIEEHDIRHGFKMINRTERFDIDLSDINAHTFRIMEIIEDEKNSIENQRHQKMKQEVGGE